MIDKKEFEAMESEIENFDEKRERIIKDSRTVLKLSKQIIYSIHRGELREAEKLLADARKELENLKAHTKSNPSLSYLPAYKVAFQEYVEAIAYYIWIKDKKLATRKELGVDTESYILGICDLTGELSRKAVNSATNQDYNTVIDIRNFVSELYGLLLKFDFRNGDLRRKFDSIKYELKKLEDLVLELKLKGKI